MSVLVLYCIVCCYLCSEFFAGLSNTCGTYQPDTFTIDYLLFCVINYSLLCLKFTHFYSLLTSLFLVFFSFYYFLLLFLLFSYLLIIFHLFLLLLFLCLLSLFVLVFLSGWFILMILLLSNYLSLTISL